MLRLSLKFAIILVLGMTCSIAFGQERPRSTPMQFITVAPANQRPMKTEIAVLGKVIEIEEKTVEAEAHKNAPKKVEHKIAVIKVDETLVGGKGLKEIKVAFIENKDDEPPVEGPKGKGRKSPPQPNLFKDQEGCFFLTKHPTIDYYTTVASSPPLTVNDQNYKAQLEEVKKISHIINEPVQALKAEKVDDRLGAALLLITKYRTAPAGESTQIEIPAEESKLIFTALLDGPWENKNALSGLLPQNVFFTLPLSDEAGFSYPTFENNQKKYVADIKEELTKWLKGAGEKYVIKKYVTKSK